MRICHHGVGLVSREVAPQGCVGRGQGGLPVVQGAVEQGQRIEALLAFGVAGGGVGLRVVLPLKRALEWLQVVLAEGIRAQVLAGPAAVALGVDAQPAAVLVTVIRFPLAVTARLGNPQEPIDGVGGAQRIRLRRLWGRHS